MDDLALKELLTDLVEVAPPDRLDLDAAVHRGRRIRARRRVGRLAGAAAACCLAVTAVWSGSSVWQSSGGSPDVQPAAIPVYTGPAFLPLTAWPGTIAGLLPGQVVATYPVGLPAPGDYSTINAAFRVRRDGHTALVRVDVWSGGGGTNGICGLGMTSCSRLAAAPEVPGARILHYTLDPRYAHEAGRAAVLLRGPWTSTSGGVQPRAAVEIQITAVAADAGPGVAGYTAGMGAPARPVVTDAELEALIQELPLPTEVKAYLTGH